MAPRHWCWAAVAVGLVLAGLELYLRLSGANPVVSDSRELWCRERARLDSASPRLVALLGDSRMETGFVPEVLAEVVPAAEPVQLALSGTTCPATLRDLAEHSPFAGLVVAAVTYGTITAEPDGTASQQPWVDFYHRAWQPPRLDAAFNLAAKLHLQGRLCCLSHNPERYLASLVRLRRYAPPPVERRVDRSIPSYHRTRQSEEDLARRLRRMMADKEPPPADRHLPQPQQDLAAVRRWVAAIRARGGDVVFVRFPSSGELLAHEQAWFPRATTWDGVAAATGADTVYFADLPPGDWPCADLSHLDWDQAHAFTRSLLAELERRGLLTRFRRS